MSKSTKDLVPSKPSANFKISFRKGLPPQEREAAQRSVTASIAHTYKKVARQQATKEERSKLRARLNAPIQRLIEKDEDALKAIREVRKRDLIHRDKRPQLDPNPLPVLSDHFTLPLNPPDFPLISSAATLRPRILDVRVPPYDFAWSFFDQPGGAPFQQSLNKDTGQVGLVTRSGSMEHGFSGFVRAHAGFGVFFTTDHAGIARGHSFRRMRYVYSMDAFGINSNATSEGGMDFGAFEDGRLLDVKISTLWHHKMSSSDPVAEEDVGPFGVYEPDELAFPVEPGHVYSFLVGIWVFSDREPGWGVAAASSLMQGKVFAISIERQG